MNYIIFKNINSQTIPGLLINELPPIVKPKMRIEETVVDGVDGSLIENLGWESYDKALQISLHGNYDIDQVIEYFNGAGKVTFSNEADKYYNAVVVEGIDFERLLRYRTATVVFRVQPYKYSLTEEAIDLTFTEVNPTFNVTNNGNTTSAPLIDIRGTGDITFKLNGNRIFSYTFDSDEKVEIDSENQDAHLSDILKNRNMSGDFPYLKKGTSTVLIEGSVSEVKLLKGSRWI